MRLRDQIIAASCAGWVSLLGTGIYFACEARPSRAGVIREGLAGGTRHANPGAQDAQSRTRTELPRTGERLGANPASPGFAQYRLKPCSAVLPESRVVGSWECAPSDGSAQGISPGFASESRVGSNARQPVARSQGVRLALSPEKTKATSREPGRGNYSQGFEGGAAWKDTQRFLPAARLSPAGSDDTADEKRGGPVIALRGGSQPQTGIKPGHHLRTLATSAAELCGVDPALFWSLVMRESSGRHWDASGRVLRSSSNALGLGQIKASTARGVSPYLDPMTPWGNALASACYYRQMLTLARGNVRRALVYYHRGPNAKGPTPKASREYASDIIEGSAQ